MTDSSPYEPDGLHLSRDNGTAAERRVLATCYRRSVAGGPEVTVCWGTYSIIEDMCGLGCAQSARPPPLRAAHGHARPDHLVLRERQGIHWASSRRTGRRGTERRGPPAWLPTTIAGAEADFPARRWVTTGMGWYDEASYATAGNTEALGGAGRNAPPSIATGRDALVGGP